MTVWRLVYLDFGTNPTHFGEIGIGMEETSERVRSDTLFSAWVSAYARLFGKDAVEDLLNQFHSNDDPPFRVSSTFIYQQKGNDTIYYLPRPFSVPKGYPIGEDLAFAKTYKKLNYIPLSVWKRWYQGKGMTSADCEELTAYTNGEKRNWELEQLGTFGYSETHQSYPVPKVAIDRKTTESNFYQTGFVKFQENAGLYFLVNFSTENETLEKDLLASLCLLGEEGLGGERSSGAGRFTPKWLSLPSDWEKVIQFNDNNIYYSLLSLYWQESIRTEELITKTTSYQIQPRGGWISSPLSGQQALRKRVRMFSEGSVFPIPPKGQLADVTPPNFNFHKIYRNGISISLPIQLKQEL